MSTKPKKKAAEAKPMPPAAFIARPAPSTKPATIILNPESAALMELSAGNFVTISKNSASCVAIVALGDVEAAVVGLPRPLRDLCGILLGDRIQISKYARQPPYAATVKASFPKELESAFKKALTAAGVLHPGLLLEVEGTTITIDVDNDAIAAATAKLAGLNLSNEQELVSPPFLFHSSTKIENTEIKLENYNLPQPLGFAQVGGLNATVALLRQTVQLPLHHAALFRDFGISPPRGVLLHGPPGTGKTMLLRCVAHEADAHVLTVDGPLLVSKYLGETESALRDVFAEAVKYQPSIVFMDEIDSLAPKRGLDDAGEAELRVVATLLTMMDGMGQAGRVVVVGATNRPNSIDPALRRPGRFDQEVEVGIPDAEARVDILTKQLARMNPAKCGLSPEDIQEVAQKTHGYVGADLAALCREAVMKTIGRALSKGSLLLALTLTEGLTDSNNSNLSIGLGQSLGASLALGNALKTLDPSARVERRDLEAALVEVRPSAMREIFLEMPKVSWADIAGQHELKQKLMEVVQLPLEAAPTFARLGIAAPKGVLLYGPPGCSKTLTAKALASESGLNFLAVKGPEIFSKYVGESERTVREVFRKARAAAPSIIFFDEIDALASAREDGGTQAAQHVLTSLLNEIDGVEELQGVVVVAATNRPSEIDSALLRPGRLDRHIYVAPPDREARLQLITRRCAQFSVPDSEPLFERLADATDGCSGAEVALLCQEAGLAAIMEDKEALVVHERHFNHALEGISRGITPEMLEYYEDFSKRSGLSM